MQGDMHPPEHLQTQLDQGNADPSGHDQNTVDSHAFPERSLPPPLHPPATLRS
jgi:hypothetical protein